MLWKLTSACTNIENFAIENVALYNSLLYLLLKPYFNVIYKLRGSWVNHACPWFPAMKYLHFLKLEVVDETILKYIINCRRILFIRSIIVLSLIFIKNWDKTIENYYSSVTPDRDQGIGLCRPIVTTYKKDANSWQIKEY